MRFLRRRAHQAEPQSVSSSPPTRTSTTQQTWTDPNWLAWQTLTYSGSAQIKTAGVSYHKDDLRAVAARHGRLVMAELRVEEDGQYAGAVRVYVGGVQLGSVPHGLGPQFRDVIHRLDASGQPTTCRADLDAKGGAYVDVWLCAKPRERAAGDPFLPPMLGERLSLAEDVVAYLDDVVLGRRAKSKRVVRTAELAERDGRWTVALDGRELGVLPGGRYPRLVEARAGGFPLTCQVRILRQPERPLRVEVDFPTG